MKNKNLYKLSSEVWLYPGMAGWHFISVSKKESGEIKKNFGKAMRGWGSLPVFVRIGKTSWNTSIFWDKKEDAYLLPLKAMVRIKAKLVKGDKIDFKLEILP